MSTPRHSRIFAALRCPNPACARKGSLDKHDAPQSSVLRCLRCGGLYPVVDGMPLLVSPAQDYIERMRRDCAAVVGNLGRFQATVGTSDPYFQFAEVWRARASACLEDMLTASASLLERHSEPDSPPRGPQAPSATEAFKAEYSDFEVIEEYLKSAYGPYLRPPAGNREGFYATVLSAGKMLPRDSTILDVGCGVGRTLLDYSQLCPDGLVVGLDFVYAMIKLARRVVVGDEPVPLLLKEDMRQHEIRELQGFGRDNVAFVSADAQQLPFADSTFDCVLGNYIYSIVDDYPSALQEAMRVLRPGGMLIITNSFSWEGLREPVRRHNPEDLNAVLRTAGMDIDLDFDFANLNTANPRQTYIRHTRLTLAKKRV